MLQRERQQFGPDKPNGATLATPLINFIQTCTDYVYDLPLLERYCVWRYTIGSASINKNLIFGEVGDNGPYWTYLFFNYAKNNGITNTSVLGPFGRYVQYFRDPESYKKLPKETSMPIATVIINMYTEVLRTIILNAPPVPRGGFDVFKVASIYPGLPSRNPMEFQRSFVEQIPFNSTTVSPNFNFAPFLADLPAESVLFTIFIPQGSRVLWVPSEMHAYAWENEIILPPGCAFDIYRVEQGTLDYVDKNSVNVVNVQKPAKEGGKIVIGNVYDVDRYKPCKSGNGGCFINKRAMPVFRSVYSPPE